MRVEHGATVLTRTPARGCASRTKAGWRHSKRADGRQRGLRARCVVNATGPWVRQFLDEATPLPARHHPRQIKGSHIVVPQAVRSPVRLHLPGADGRIVFAIPYEGDFTLIGTTERDYTGDLARPAIERREIEYLRRHGQPVLLDAT